MKGKGATIDDYLGDTASLTAAAHELKTPLALIRQLGLLAGDSRLDETERSELLDRMVLTSERALRLVTDLTRRARLEDGLFTLEPISASAICDDVVETLQPLYAARGRQLKLRAARRVPAVVANRELLARIVTIFADNALEYGAETQAVRVEVGSIESGHRVRVRTRDYGPAIPTQVWRSLSASLGQVPQPLHARPGSSGLGLLLAGEFARTMGARVGAVRHRDGVSFFVDLDTSRQLSLLQ